MIPKCSRMIIFFYSIFPTFTTNLSQHFHICYIHFLHALLPNWSIFCTVGQNRSNHCLLKYSFFFLMLSSKMFLQSHWSALITKHSISEAPLQPSSSYSTFDLLLNLLIFTNYKPKVLKGLSLWYLLNFKSYELYLFAHLYLSYNSNILPSYDLSNSPWILKPPYHPPTLYHYKAHTPKYCLKMSNWLAHIINAKRQELKANPCCKHMVIENSSISS